MPTPTDLLDAIGTWWNGSSGLASSVGPLFAVAVQVGAVPPYCLLERPQSNQPGVTLDDEFEDVYFTVASITGADAMAKGQLIRLALDPPTSNRSPFAWTTGHEIGPREMSGKLFTSGKGPSANSLIYRYQMHYQIWVIRVHT